MNKARLIEFQEHGDENGHLVVIEENINVPFDIKRVFYIYGSRKDILRGNHANRKSEFMLINVSGTSKVRVDNGVYSEVFNLDRAHVGVYIPRMVWKEMYDFSADSVLLVLSSELYDPDEYIRNKNAYYAEVNGLT
ncbi:MAG: FdtA/QdtA family cupin domain-containing protein [Flexilinea sp.]